MIFCIDNITKTTPTTEVGNLTNYPFSNLTTDTLQDVYYSSSFTLNYNGSGYNTTDITRVVLAGLYGHTTVRLQINGFNAGNVFDKTDSSGDSLITFDTSGITADALGAVVVTFDTVVSFGHLYIGSPYELPDPVFGSVPNYDDNDFVSDGQSGKQFVTDGHTWREQGFSVVEATEASYDTFVSFITGANRRKPFVFFQTEDNLSLFPPYFARIDGKPEFGGRNIRKKFRWEFKIREVF